MPSEPAFDLDRARLAAVARREAPWRDPIAVLTAFAEEPYAAFVRSGGGWAYLLRQPDAVTTLEAGARGDPWIQLAGLLGEPVAADCQAPPFQGGVVGLAAYELGARLEATAPAERDPDWPDLILARYPAMLAFHEGERRLIAVGRGSNEAEASAKARHALGWLEAARPEPEGPLAAEVRESSRGLHAAAVAETIGRIAAGEIFQANLARPWRGTLAAGRTPFDLFRRLERRSPAPYGAYLRLPGKALVSNSPERFLSVRREADGLWAESRPIKGTRPRGADAASDAAQAKALLASSKDRAENLMIVDLMRNDLARACVPGSVSAPELAALKSYANVHHLVSRVRGRLAAGKSAWDAFLGAFPPGSITGAPKLQAMQVIARHEPPRGPYCGSLFWAGLDGTLEGSVLIRTVALAEESGGWRFEARAGGGIVADSDPRAEVEETRHKISAILGALADDA